MDVSAVFAGFVSWQYLLILLGIILVGALYVSGVRRLHTYSAAARLHWWNVAAFVAGLVIVAAALHPEMDRLAHQWFWLHMVQNEALALVGAFLLVLGMPAWAFWHALPLSARAVALRWVLRKGGPRSLLGAIGRWVFPAWLAALIYMISFSVWHVPPIYDAAETSRALYALLLVMFLVTGILLWSQVIAWRPGTHGRLGLVASMIYLILIGMYSNLLGSIYMFSTVPFYPYYIHQHPAGGAALVDQHLAGAAMDVPGVLLLWAALSVFLWIWLSEDEKAGQAEVAQANAATKS